MASISELLEKNVKSWRKAVCHPFLVACADGDCPKESFDLWLVRNARTGGP